MKMILCMRHCTEYHMDKAFVLVIISHNMHSLNIRRSQWIEYGVLEQEQKRAQKITA